MAGTILPAIAFEEALETTRIHSIAGLPRPGDALVARRPSRAPHHSISQPGRGAARCLSRGKSPWPKTARCCWDELPEFPRAVLEHRRVTIFLKQINPPIPRR